MKKKLYYPLMLLSFILVGLSSCTASREREIDDEISDFRSWVNDQSATVADRTEQDWKQAKEDFKMRTQELDKRQDNFSAELKQEYKQLKDDFKSLDEERAKRRRSVKLAEWEVNLLGRYADKSTITRENVKQVYEHFMENVRTREGNWINEDWEMAKMVLEKLNERKEEIDESISTEDEVSIKALQMEFKTLETANDAGVN
jgi:chromosome segregation ATPase